MSLFRVTQEKLEKIPSTTFAAENLLERKDIQRLLRADITPVGNDLMIIAEEYGEWEDSNRRIDLLCLSKEANLVVIEIKRTEDGGHMELQAVRYAAMVSSLTLDQAITAYSQMQKLTVEDAKDQVLEFLQLESDVEGELTGEVRIVLVSANFSTELTTAVLWLNRHDLDITCIRLIPYRLQNDILIDATQIIPLPESADYEVKVREQAKEKRKVTGAREQIFRKFWSQLIERSKGKTQLLANRNTSESHWISAAIGRAGFNLAAVLVKDSGQVECLIQQQGGAIKNKAAFKSLFAQKDEIEKKFGGPLDWQELPGKLSCRICQHLPGGWQSPESEWPAIQDSLIDSLIRMESAFREPIKAVKV